MQVPCGLKVLVLALVLFTFFSNCSGSDHIQKNRIFNFPKKPLLHIASIRGGAQHTNPLSVNHFATVLTTIISPSVSGGLLSGGLHAISG